MSTTKQWWKWTLPQWETEVTHFITQLRVNSEDILSNYKGQDPLEVADFIGRLFLGVSDEVISNMQHVCEVASMVLPDEDIKKRTGELFNEIKLAGLSITLNPKWVDVLLYLEKNTDDAIIARICGEVKQQFILKGLYLSKSDAQKFTKLSTAIKKLVKEFDFENDTYLKYILCEKEDLEGLSPAYISGLEVVNGKYKITTAAHHAGQFITYTPNLSKARELAVLGSQRGGVKNLQRLHKIATMRNEIAQLVGFATFADMNISTRSEKKLATLFSLAKKLNNEHTAFYKIDMKLLREVGGYKKQEKIPNWMTGRINKKITDTVLKLPDNQTLKNYFGYERVLPMVLEDLCELLSLTCSKNSTTYWHKDVVSYSFFDKKTGQKFGDICFDMLGRKNKNEHPCCAAYTDGKKNKYMYDVLQKEIRTSLIIMPLAAKTKTTPTLMSLYDIQVLFHELGHAFHNILGSHHVGCLAGYYVSMDCVEIPSQLFENFLLNVSTIKKYSQHFETKEPLATSVIKKILACRHLFSGYGNKYQLHNYTYDLLIHSNQYNEDPKELYRNNFLTYIPDLEPLPESTSPSSFGHIVHGYEAGYYTYMWTLLIAYDIAGYLKSGNGWSAKKIKEFRTKFLEAGNSQDLDIVVKIILGRNVNTNAMVEVLQDGYDYLEKHILP